MMQQRADSISSSHLAAVALAFRLNMNPVSMGFAAVRYQARECCRRQQNLHELTCLEVLPYMAFEMRHALIISRGPDVVIFVCLCN